MTDLIKSDIYKKMKKEFGDEFAVPLSEIDDKKKGIVKTYPSLDFALSGGLARGQFAQIAGKPKVGKTTLAFGIAANFLKQYKEGVVFYYKVEGRLSSSLAHGVQGLDTDRIIVIKSNPKKILSGADFLDIIEKNMRFKEGNMHIIDSIGGIIGDQEMSGGMSDQQRGELGKLLAKFCRRNSSVFDATNSLVLALNHVRDKMGGKGFYTPGGKHFHHQIDTDMMLSESFPDRKIEAADGEQIGHNISVLVKTTTMGPPNREAKLPLIYGEGISYKRNMFDLAEEIGIIEKAGSWYSLGEERLGQGKIKALANVCENEEFFSKIEEQTLNALGLTDEDV